MKDIPILFNGEMVRAILEGRKTQTRRIIKPQPEFTSSLWPNRNSHMAFWEMQKAPGNYCPLGAPGDRLWVRETWRVFGGREYEYQQEQAAVRYRADAEFLTKLAKEWRPSIFMPRWACRLHLRVVAVRVERLQDITGGDCIAEGIAGRLRGPLRTKYWALWDRINAKRGFGWMTNPWVWVIEFKKD